VVPVVRLTEVFRQAATSKIITSANLIREGKMPDLQWEPALTSYIIKRETPQEIAATLVELVRNRNPEGV